jgi:hypothetical protein
MLQLAAPPVTTSHIDAQLAGHWARYRAYIRGVRDDVNAVECLALIDRLLEQRLAITRQVGSTGAR